MKKRLIIPTAVAVFSLLGAGAAATATTVGTDAGGTSTAAAKCSGGTKEWAKANTNVKVRKKPSTKSPGLRLWYKGTKGCWIKGLKGGKYSKCGMKNWNGWGYVEYRGTRGYVPNMCVIPAK
ncbi:hypothetical protein [Streptomyces sp. NPDC048172]|uniref:hypothetical protein n=1 Tax=Streptomyces sp. NPDC048172 TaxID=3365505 RepID=UPI003711C4EA